MLLVNSIVIIYTLALMLVLIFAFAQLHLLVKYQTIQSKEKNFDSKLNSEVNQLPFVTIQLPIYNEKYVTERLLHCIAKIQYPKELLQIQVLDDSDDGSETTTAKIITQLQEEGIPIMQLCRKHREQFKAGALRDGLLTAHGEFIAIFDADFLPGCDWLIKTVSYFNNPLIGLVQTRWSHINKSFSLLTRAQAFALDLHFTLEQSGRNQGGYPINFNGTAGIWRKSCILDAGNWDGSTLTEDLDLSYRAQLKGWKFIYLEEVATPSELPIAISAAKSQQFRWNKGGAQNFIRWIPKVMKHTKLSLTAKWHAFVHLFSSSLFVIAFLIAVLSVPMLYIQNEYAIGNPIKWLHHISIISILILILSHWVVHKKLYGTHGKKLFQYLLDLFAFLMIALGFTLHNTLAVIEAYLRVPSNFIRTPKFNITTRYESPVPNEYINRSFTWKHWLEIGILIYFVCAVLLGVYLSNYAFLGFHILLVMGYGYLVIQSIKLRWS